MTKPEKDLVAISLDMAEEIKRLRAENAKQRALLEKLQWADYQGSACLICEVWRDDGKGHAPDCELAAAIK